MVLQQEVESPARKETGLSLEGKAIRLVIDGEEIAAQEGMTVFQAAQAAGRYIPHLCYYPSLSPAGTCRLCVVDVAGMRGLPCSCTLPVAEGMAVSTRSPRVQEFRRATLEVILKEHPNVCLTCHKRSICGPLQTCLKSPSVTERCVICPENARCELQRVVTEVGLQGLKLPPVSLNPELQHRDVFFDRDYSLCIRCGRCVRVCQELRGNRTIVFTLDRGNLSVDTPLGRSLQDSGCEFCGACVDSCPTGALLDLAPQGRLGRFVTTVCPYCGVGCQLNLEVQSGRIVRSAPDPEGPANRGQACVKGRFGIAEFVHSPERLTKPLVSRNGKFQEVSWGEALDQVATALARYQGDQVAVISSAKATNEENYIAQKFARVVLGTNNIDHCARLCHAPSVAGLAQSFGSGAMTNPIADIANAACILAIGSDTCASHPVIGLEVQKAVRRGGRLIVANPKEIKLTRAASLWLRQRPGSDVALIMGMMRVIVEEGLQDDAFIKERCENFDDFRRSLESFPLDFVEETTGVPRDLIIQAARTFATHKPGSIIYAMGITQHSHGTDNVMALANLAMLTGNVGKPSTGVNPLRGQNNVQGSCDMGALPNVFPGYQPLANPEVRAKFEAAWGCSLKDSPGLTLTEVFQAAHQGKVKAVYIIGENPVLSDPDAGHVREALDRLEFLVVQDIFLTETAQFADVVLPAASFAEKDGTFTNTERRVQRVRKAIDEVGKSRPDWWITCQIARRMGGKGFDFQHPSQIMQEIARLTPSYGGISYERLERQSLVWPCPKPDHPGTPMLHKDSFVRGKGRFMPLTYKPPLELPDDDYPLMLTTGRTLYHYHTGTMTRKVKGLNTLRGQEMVEINPGDAQRLGIRDSDLIRVLSRRGSVMARARVTPATPPGVVSMTFHFAESPANVLTNPVVDPVAKIPEFKVCAVRVEKITEAAHV